MGLVFFSGRGWVTAWNICSNCMMQSCQHQQESQRNVLGNHAESMSWGHYAGLKAKRSPTPVSTAFQIKCPVGVSSLSDAQYSHKYRTITHSFVQPCLPPSPWGPFWHFLPRLCLRIRQRAPFFCGFSMDFQPNKHKHTFPLGYSHL